MRHTYESWVTHMSHGSHILERYFKEHRFAHDSLFCSERVSTRALPTRASTRAWLTLLQQRSVDSHITHSLAAKECRLAHCLFISVTHDSWPYSYVWRITHVCDALLVCVTHDSYVWPMTHMCDALLICVTHYSFHSNRHPIGTGKRGSDDVIESREKERENKRERTS